LSTPTPVRNSAAYQVMLVALLSLNFGIVFFDRNSLNFLMPFVQSDLGLNNTEVGILASALSLTWALAAFGIGLLSDKTGRRKVLLILATLAFSLCSFASGIATSFAMMLGARLLMGVAEGGIMPISQTLIAAEVEPGQRGLAMGITQNFGSNLLGSFAAPVLLVGFATAYGWRHAFFLAAVPGLIAAFLLWRFVREPQVAATVTVMGICMGTGEILGGVLSPSIAGYAADHSGLEAPLWMMFGLTVAAGLLALGLRETAPRVLARRLAAERVAAT
jgi:MFS family permease